MSELVNYILVAGAVLLIAGAGCAAGIFYVLWTLGKATRR